ncbi:PemK-like, MazF-like toxin of type II toxin-antitoxin system [Bacillus oleivorans]|uniref:PemK-like, MazF-like toxin of type II toxin-antitoxin system n=1 Tax=Bacillus oleivorans TaxID=1448271 RepID=A0A285D5M6_9BACI|nr:PemK-like, MazF-like toxin of type II toxin-antitoxin system [Bacillus oleivorans]
MLLCGWKHRKFEFGSVWKIDDRDVTIPQVDKLGKRKEHEERWVVVISNNRENYHQLCPIVTVAPLSHRTDLKKPFDLGLHPKNEMWPSLVYYS